MTASGWKENPAGVRIDVMVVLVKENPLLWLDSETPGLGAWQARHWRLESWFLVRQSPHSQLPCL